jgi:hypothetical protein
MDTFAPSLADRFGYCMRWLATGIGIEQRRMGLGFALADAIGRRLSGLWTRLLRVFARLREGTLRPPRPRASRAGATAAEGAPRPARPPSLLPRQFGWLKGLMPPIAHYMNAFISLLADAEMAAIVARAPQVGRILRPFCHLLGLPMPEYLKLPKRVRVRKRRTRPHRRVGCPRQPTTPPHVPPKPVDVTKLSPVAYGNIIHAECEAHPVGMWPPNRIGYARSRWPPKNRE